MASIEFSEEQSMLSIFVILENVSDAVWLLLVTAKGVLRTTLASETINIINSVISQSGI